MAMSTAFTVIITFTFDEYAPTPAELERTIQDYMFYDEDNPATAIVVAGPK